MVSLRKSVRSIEGDQVEGQEFFCSDCQGHLKMTGDGDLLLRGEKYLTETGSSGVIMSFEGCATVGFNGVGRWFKS